MGSRCSPECVSRARPNSFRCFLRCCVWGLRKLWTGQGGRRGDTFNDVEEAGWAPVSKLRRVCVYLVCVCGCVLCVQIFCHVCVYEYMCVCVSAWGESLCADLLLQCVCVCVCVCLRECVCMCMHVYVYVCVWYSRLRAEIPKQYPCCVPQHKMRYKISRVWVCVCVQSCTSSCAEVQDQQSVGMCTILYLALC